MFRNRDGKGGYLAGFIILWLCRLRILLLLDTSAKIVWIVVGVTAEGYYPSRVAISSSSTTISSPFLFNKIFFIDFVKLNTFLGRWRPVLNIFRYFL